MIESVSSQKSNVLCEATARSEAVQERESLAGEDAMAASIYARKAKSSPAETTKKESAVPVEKIKLCSKVQTLQETRVRKLVELGEHYNKAKAKLNKALEDAENPNKESVLETLGQLEKGHVLAHDYLDQALQDRYAKVLKDVNKAGSADTVMELKSLVSGLHKELVGEKVKAFNDMVRNVNVTFAAMCRTKGASVHKAAKAALQPARASPLYTILDSGLTMNTHNLCNSVFEAKAGVRASHVVFSSHENYFKVTSSPVCKKAFGKCVAGLKRGLSCCKDSLSSGQMVNKRFEEVVVAACGAELRTKRTLPKQDWASKVFEFQAFASDAATALAHWPPFALMQVMVLTEGSMAVAGLKSDRVPGNSYADKRDYIMKATVDDIDHIIKDGGFFSRYRDGAQEDSGENAILIPSGFMLVMSCSNARILQWSLVADMSDTNRVKDSLRNVLTSFTELRNPETGYMQFAEHLGVQ